MYIIIDCSFILLITVGNMSRLTERLKVRDAQNFGEKGGIEKGEAEDWLGY